MNNACIICREVPAGIGESYCEVCVKTLDPHAGEPGSTIEVPPVAQKDAGVPQDVIFIIPRPDGSPAGQVRLRRDKKAS